MLTFASADDLRDWLKTHHAKSNGMWLRIFKTGSGVVSVTFREVLDERLCFGWSESMRRKYDEKSYLATIEPGQLIQVGG